MSGFTIRVKEQFILGISFCFFLYIVNFSFFYVEYERSNDTMTNDLKPGIDPH